jgi:PAP2 superfamily
LGNQIGCRRDLPFAHVPRRRAAWLAEVALIVAFDVAYEWLRNIRSVAPADATERARSILAIERWLHVAVEQRINEFTTAHTWLASAAGYYYCALHFVVTPAVMIWLCRRRQQSYATWRTVLALATMGALLTYLLFPVAPPRLALPGFTDTLIVGNVFGAADPHGVSGLINLYAAMPSLHVGWAFWVALAAFNSTSGRFRWLAWLYPIVTTLVVMATANHFLLDGAAGSAYVASAYAVVRGNRARSARGHAQRSRVARYLNPPQAELARACRR